MKLGAAGVRKLLGGFATGLTGCCVLIAVILFGSSWLGVGSRNEAASGVVPVRLAGRTASQLGGARVEVDLWGDVIREDCRGVCDDLSDVGAVRAVRITDAAGRCVDCRRVKLLDSKAVETPPLLTRGSHD